ncbi:MAG: peptidylprolyl isomerase [Clostridia bacterium]|nr:peptidylprolyl isomerase [Clostridia bacterium]
MLANFAIEKAISGIKITDEEVKKFYDEHKAELMGGETVEASHILVDTKEKAEEILAEINEGKISFEDAAKEHSSCPSSQQGGNLGQFGRGQMVPEFDKAVFEMNDGEIAGPVQTQFGYHLIKLNKKNEAKEIPFDEIKAQLSQKVLSDKQQAAYASKLNQLKILFPVDIF